MVSTVMFLTDLGRVKERYIMREGFDDIEKR